MTKDPNAVRFEPPADEPREPAPVPPPPSSAEPPSSAGPPAASALGPTLPVVAAIALVTVLLGRVGAPAVKRAGLVLGGNIDRVERLGNVATQFFAVIAAAAAVGAILSAARSRQPIALRLAALTLGAFVLLPTAWALHEPVRDSSMALVGAGAAGCALVGAVTAFRVPFARHAAAIVGLVSLGGLVRLGAVFFALKALDKAGPVFATLARGTSTVALLLDMLALGVALSWIAARGKKLMSPATLVAVGVTLLATRQALLGQNEEARAVDLFFWRAADLLMMRPDAALPLGLRVFVAFLAPALAAAALASRDGVMAIGACVALALCARGAPEMPLSALMLVIAGLGLPLVASDARAVWGSLGRRR